MVEDGRNSDVESISGSESEEEEGTGAAKVSKERSPIVESGKSLNHNASTIMVNSLS
jgi:hypothetical protein